MFTLHLIATVGTMEKTMLNLLLILTVSGVIANGCGSDNSNDGKRSPSLRENEVVVSGYPKISEYEGKERPTINRNCSLCFCGLAMENEQSEEGGRVGVQVFPWLSILLKRGKYLCFGSLINDRYVVTAASCIWNENSTNNTLKSFKIIFVTDYGEGTLPQRKSHTRRISDIKPHPMFMPGSLDSDIALVQLRRPVQFQLGIMPICLPKRGSDFTEKWGTVAGLGIIPDSPYSILMQSRQPIITMRYCTNPYYGYSSRSMNKITKNMICTAPWDSPLCLKGRGGPLMVEVEELQQLAGIVSWGKFCNGTAKPIVYTKITEFVDWIWENTIDACYCE